MQRTYAQGNNTPRSTAWTRAASAAEIPSPPHGKASSGSAKGRTSSSATIANTLIHNRRILEDQLRGLVWAVPGINHLFERAVEDKRIYYDLNSLSSRRSRLKYAAKHEDIEDLLGLFRCLLIRGVGGIDNPHAPAPDINDRKHPFHRYTKTVLHTVDHINKVFDSCQDRDTRRHIYECVCDTISAFGKSATLLSGGGTLGMYHIGVLETFRKTDPKLVSQVISGASAGSIVAAVFGSKREEDLDEAVEKLCHGDLDVFTSAEEQRMGWIQKILVFLERRSWFDPQNLERVMRDLLGDMTFKDAFNLTGRKLNITVSTLGAADDDFLLLNYINTPDVVIWSAVVASCAVPIAFPAGQLYYRAANMSLKRMETPVGHADGSLYGDVPMDRMSREFNVNFFVVSQVNPHVIPFLDSDKAAERSYTAGIVPLGRAAVRHAILSALDTLKQHTVPGQPTLAALHSIFDQRYEGDLTLFPVKVARDVFDISLCMLNPTHEFMDRAVKHGREEAEKMLPKAHAVLDIEMLLQDLKLQLRTKLRFSKSEEDMHRKEIEQRMQSRRSYNALSRREQHHQSGKQSMILHSHGALNAAIAHRPSHSLELGYMHLNTSAEKVAGSAYNSDSGSSSSDSESNQEDNDFRITLPPRELPRFTSNPPSPIDTRRRWYFPPSRSTSRSSSRSSSPGPSMSSLRMTPRTPSPEQSRKVRGSVDAGQQATDESEQAAGSESALRRKLPRSLRSLIDSRSGLSVMGFKPRSAFRRKRSLSAGGIDEYRQSMR